MAPPKDDKLMATIAEKPWTPDEVHEIAVRQKQILWMILLSFVAMFIPFATLLTGLIQIYFIFKLSQAVRSPYAWVYVILSFLPLLGLLALLYLNGRATKILRINGFQVGLMGAKLT